jgi:CRISPR-associated protein Csm1
VPEEKLQVLDCVAEVEKGQVYGGLCTALQDEDGNTIQRAHKRLARYAPKDEKGFLLDLDKIADRATGAKFLGVLKADLDGLGEAFGELGEKESETLSGELEAFFTDELESLIRSSEKYRDIYVVYSGGDDLFLLGPWDALIRFIDQFHSQLEQSLSDARCSLTLSAGFKLAHPKSPVRFLADDVEVALAEAKGRRGRAGKLKAKNRIVVFERVIRWDELREGLKWADRFIEGKDKYDLSIGLLQRLQYYADQFRRFFDAGKIDGLRAVPLLQDDWRRNVSRVEDPLKTQLSDEIQPKLTQLGDEGERMWRVVEFASRFAVYVLR